MANTKSVTTTTVTTPCADDRAPTSPCADGGTAALGTAVRLRPRGGLDATTTTELCHGLEDVARHGPAIVLLDLADAEFVDAAALAAIVHGSRMVEECGGAVFIEGARGALARTLEVTAVLDRYRGLAAAEVH